MNQLLPESEINVLVDSGGVFVATNLANPAR